MRGLVPLGLVAVATAGGVWVWLAALPPTSGSGFVEPAPTVAPRLTAPGLVAPNSGAPEPVAPRFDVARVGARGMLVTAGRAAPGAEVTLLDSGQDIGRARADGRGEWVILPSDPLAPGLRELSLLARLPGAEPVPSPDTLLLLVPEPPPVLAHGATSGRPGATALPGAGGSPAALALLLPPTTAAAAPRLLQAAPTPDPARRHLGLDVVDYDEAGGMRFAGSAPPGARLRIYVGPRHAGDAVANPAGRWALTPDHQPAIGRHTLRVDQLAAAGSVAARIELPFQRDAIPDEALRNGRVIIQPGFSLWRIARRAYGRGTRYTVIYAANRDQIREPGRIYPGQVFSVPGEAPQAPQQAVSSRSR